MCNKTVENGSRVVLLDGDRGAEMIVGYDSTLLPLTLVNYPIGLSMTPHGVLKCRKCLSMPSIASIVSGIW